MPFESEKQRRFLWANKPDVARKFADHRSDGGVIPAPGVSNPETDLPILYHAGGGGAYSGNPAIEKQLEEIYNRKMQTTGGMYKGIIAGDMNMIRKQLYDQAARDKTARRQGGGGEPMKIGAIQGEVQDHWKHPTPMDAPVSSTMYWDPKNFKFVEGPGEGIREITQTRGDMSGINPMNNTQVKQFNNGGEVPPMFNNKGLKKLTQKDRYGNTTTYEYEAPEKPIDQTAIIKHMMDIQNAPPEMDIEIGMDGLGFAQGGSTNHPGKPKGTDTVPAWLTPGEFVMNAEAVEMYKPMIEQMNNHGRMVQAAQGGPIPRYEADGGWIDDYLLDRLRQQESGGGKYLRSPAGALGPYQIMPGTAKNPGYGLPPVKDPFDEEESREFARNYLMALQERNPQASPNEILQMYNAGEGRIRRNKAGKGKPLARETVMYPAKVLGQLGGGDEELDEANLYENWDGAVPPVLGEAEIPPADLPNIPGISQAHGSTPPPAEEPVDKGQLVGMSEQLAGITQEMQEIRQRNKGKPMDAEDSIRLRELQVQRNKIADEYDAAAATHGTEEVNTPTGKKEQRVIDDWNERDNLKMLDEDAVLEDMEAYRQEQLEGNVPEREVPTIESEVSPIFGPSDVPMGELPEEETDIKIDPSYTEDEALRQIRKQTVENKAEAQQLKKTPNKEIEAEGKKALEEDPSLMDRVGTAFTNAFSNLLDDDALAEAAIMYLGSRALGYSHAGSLRWTAGKYLQGRQDAKAAEAAAAAKHDERVFDLAKSDKFSPASVAEYKKTGDVSKLRPKGGNIKRVSAQPTTMYDDKGKSYKVWEYDGPDGKYMGNSAGAPIPDEAFSMLHTDEWKVPGTKAYNDRVNGFRKISEDQIKSLRGQFGKVPGTGTKDTPAVYQTDINPATQAGEIAKWAAKNNINAEDLAGLVESAYHDALNDERQDGKRVRDLTPYLNQLTIRKLTGTPDIFTRKGYEEGDKNRYVAADKLAIVNDAIGRQLPKGFTTKTVADQYYNAMIEKWNALGEEGQKAYNNRANNDESGFYVYIANDLGVDTRMAKK